MTTEAAKTTRRIPAPPPPPAGYPAEPASTIAVESIRMHALDVAVRHQGISPGTRATETLIDEAAALEAYIRAGRPS